MATDQNQEEFYGELDKYRHSAGLGCILGFFVLGLIFLAAVWYVVSKLYF